MIDNGTFAPGHAPAVRAPPSASSTASASPRCCRPIACWKTARHSGRAPPQSGFYARSTPTKVDARGCRPRRACAQRRRPCPSAEPSQPCWSTRPTRRSCRSPAAVPDAALLRSHRLDLALASARTSATARAKRLRPRPRGDRSQLRREISRRAMRIGMRCRRTTWSSHSGCTEAVTSPL